MKRFSLILLAICSSITLFGQADTACTQTVSGEVRDGISTDVLVGAEVVLSTDSGTVLETQTIKEDGAFTFTIKCETAYKIEGRQQDYTAESKTFTTTNEDKKVLKLIILLDKGNIDFVSDSQANAKAIDSVAKAEVVTTEVKPEIVAEEIISPVIEQEVVEEPEAVKVKEPAKVVYNSNELTIAPVYFEYESSWLNEKTRGELQKVVNLMKQYPQMVVQCNGYTDSKGEEDYNQWMSDRRSKRVIDYLIQSGISSSRISGKGFGETNLRNDCTNEKECTDEQRAINRRTEIVIVKM